MGNDAELKMLNAARRSSRMFVVFHKLTRDILDDLPILHGRRHLE
jgi:hypothetical protein